MPSTMRDLPFGHSIGTEAPIRSSVELGAIIREQRKRLALKQLDLAGLGNTGNRFIVDLENGKPTVQLQKVLDLMDLLGLEVVVRAKAARTQARRYQAAREITPALTPSARALAERLERFVSSTTKKLAARLTA